VKGELAEFNLFDEKALEQGFDLNKNTVYLNLIPSNIGRDQLLEVIRPLLGFSEGYLTLSEVSRSQEFARYGWITFPNEENANAALEELTNKKIGDFELKPSKNDAPAIPHKTTQSLSTGATSQDLDLSKQLIERFDRIAGIENNAILTVEKSDEVKLSLQILYLRRVHAFDFHSAE